MTAHVAETILRELQHEYSVGEHQQIDRATGETAFHVDATNPKTGETWTVNAPTAYQAAFELARQIGWDFE